MTQSNQFQLQIRISGKQPEIIDLHPGESLRIGGAGDCDITLPMMNENEVSARLDVLSNRLHVLDLESNQGLQINRQQVEHGFLYHGDTVHFGDCELTIVSAGDGNHTIDSDDHVQTIDLEGPPTPQFPDQIGEYQLIRSLGKGGMGEVYLGKRVGVDEQVAIKLLRDEAVTPSVIPVEQMFSREAKLLRDLDHPKIVKYLDHGREGTIDYLILEFIDLVPFLPILEKQNFAQRVRLAVGIGCQMLEALEYAHRQSVVHRDIKPENVLTFKNLGKLTAKLSDFGLSKNFIDEQSVAITGEGQIGGSLKFIAPEQFLDYINAEPRSDLYSLAGTIYYWLTGFAPHTDSSGDLYPIQSLPECQIIPVESREPRLPQSLAEAIHRELEKEPKRRYLSAEHMREVLLPFSKKEVLKDLLG